MNTKARLDIKELAKSVRQELGVLGPLSDKCCIYKVPERSRKLNPEAYTPRAVSVGPLHHGKQELRVMEEHKRRYLFDFLQWSDSSLEDFITCIGKQETRLRNCYAETIVFSSQEFVKMILIDATFLVTFLLKVHFAHLRSRNDRISRNDNMFDISRDIILLENQVPFFILEDLFKLSNLAERVEGLSLSMIGLTHSFFQGRWGSWVTGDILEQQDFSEVEHFLDFLRICQQPPKLKPPRKLEKIVLPTVTQLHDAGVKFELSPSQNKLSIAFDKGILKIPHFRIEDTVEVLLRNLQAFEECHCSGEMYANDYIAMIGMLIKDAKDVEILDQNGIIENWIGNNQAVATLFARMEVAIRRNQFYFAATLQDLNDYCKNPWHKMKGSLRQDYFNTPWAGISVFAASILLVLTVIQTVCSILEVA
ncbi:putative UPF0481 protein At3g02645 [Ricinus communis]|uniref:DUF247 domain-containing protein n=1 Tax=Ricinus communis TaxID=3988 RepID=B9SHQ4_RICCO|nr:putative UPF0481 protein At3g02645 [Ricinus communis]EEF36881.1 conserved hypothetical protein [Ricinus communis]|eukprot:XP_025014288.1 putative UPF0481 protein At3g02645 [Ricinus communis]